ncbi:MAG: ABC transporter permease [Blastocatellia bacterium]|jgi:oligopeptide transport system permease protein|nr:ABC transporter permease [Blastocatellia bacterium]
MSAFDPTPSYGSVELTPAGPVAPLPVSELVEGTSLWKDAWRRLRKNHLAVFGGVVLLVIVALALVGAMQLGNRSESPFFNWIPDPLPYQFDSTNLEIANEAPSWSHWMGTDVLGRDLVVRLMVGGAISLMVGLVSTAVSFVIGVSYGAVAGYLGGRTDQVMMRTVDIIYSLPYIFLVIVLVSIAGRSFLILFAALGAVSWLTMARIVRGQVLSLKHQEFVEAARCVGASTFSMIFRHIVPNTLGPVIVYTTLTVPTVMLQEAFLSFLGLGVPPPFSSWGTMVNDGVVSMAIYPWQLIFPAVTLALTLLSLNFVGDGLRDALDPQMRRE